MLLILAGVTIAQLTGNGILNKAQTASDETKKSQATEAINLKITNIQISSYAETQTLPNLQYLADKLCEDNDIQYVLTASKEHASLAETDTKPKIDVTNFSSIFTKLKEYSYEFEINSSLQLASIDGIKIATVPSNDDDTIVSMTKAELKKIIQDEVDAKLSSSNTNTSISNNYSTTEQVVGTWIDGKPLYRKGYTNITITSSSGNENQQVIDSNITTSNGYQVNKFYGSFIDSPNVIVNPLPNMFVLSDGSAYYVGLGVNNRGLILSNNYKGFVGRTATVFIEYTKVTDEAQNN